VPNLIEDFDEEEDDDEDEEEDMLVFPSSPGSPTPAYTSAFPPPASSDSPVPATLSPASPSQVYALCTVKYSQLNFNTLYV
jgi:hypothetical protein